MPRNDQKAAQEAFNAVRSDVPRTRDLIADVLDDMAGLSAELHCLLRDLKETDR